MTEYLGYDVIALKRIRIIISLISVGRFRDLTDSEIKELNELIEHQAKPRKPVYQSLKI
jgi:23S rRNA pseudouridine2604 synthase